MTHPDADEVTSRKNGESGSDEEGGLGVAALEVDGLLACGTTLLGVGALHE